MDEKKGKGVSRRDFLKSIGAGAVARAQGGGVFTREKTGRSGGVKSRRDRA
jgi:anaerobic selenocysteine-containing dehydrogenase